MKSLLNKTLEKTTLSQILRKMLQHFEKQQFFRNEKFGFNGEMVKSHVKHEWLLSNFVTCDEPVFKVLKPSHDQVEEIVNMAEKLPLSIVNVEAVLGDNLKMFENGKEVEMSQYFLPKTYTILKKETFCYPSLSTEFFHKQQRVRKIWWRKFSSLPGRFGMTEIRNTEKGSSVEITADFPWGTESVESIQCLIDSSELQMKDGRKTITPHSVISECKLESAAFLYMCDAYDALNEETDRDMMRFHRKMAPFKITFAASATTAQTGKELSDLALVLARKIRKLGIPCLLLPNMTKSSLDHSFLRADAMGIPYTIVMNDKTLNDGMLGIRSRDTTLKEQSHVGIVVPYVEQLMKNS